MDFEDILKEVGGYGPYQKTLVSGFLIPAFVVLPWFSLNLIFMSNTPEHWCRVPPLANLSQDERRRLSSPPSDPSCSVYDVDFAAVLRQGNWTEGPDRGWPTRECADGWEYDRTDYEATASTRWDMVCQYGHYSSLVLSLIFIGDVFGTPLYGLMSDRFGRKPTFLFLAALVAATEIGSVLSPSFVLFLVLRAVNGSAMSTIYAVGYIICLELVSPSMRARINGLGTTAWTLGLCLLPLVAYLTAHWVRLSIVTTCAAAALLLYARVLPESPSWLISRERYEDAEAIMVRISKRNGRTAHEGEQLKQMIQKLGEKIKKQKEEKASPLDFFKYPTLRKRFILVTICWIGNSIPYFGLQMNVKNLAGSEFLNFFLVSIIELPAHVATWLFMERLGRRWCSVCAFSVSTTACLLPVLFPSQYELMGVVASLVAKAGTSSAFMTLYQQSPELFPTNLRGVGMGLSCTIGTGSTLLVPYIVYLAKFGSFLPFLVFACFTVFSGVCASFLPETLNKRLPQTVQDAENFERGFSFFGCSGRSEEESESVPSSWTPAVLSAADLKSSAASEPTKGTPVVLLRTGSTPPEAGVNPAS